MELANTMQEYLQRGGVQDAAWNSAVRTLVKLVNPLAPHVAEEMWERLGEQGMLADQARPAFDPAAAGGPKLTLAVHGDGKLSDRLGAERGPFGAVSSRRAPQTYRSGCGAFARQPLEG